MISPSSINYKRLEKGKIFLIEPVNLPVKKCDFFSQRISKCKFMQAGIKLAKNFNKVLKNM